MPLMADMQLLPAASVTTRSAFAWMSSYLGVAGSSIRTGSDDPIIVSVGVAQELLLAGRRNVLRIYDIVTAAT